MSEASAEPDNKDARNLGADALERHLAQRLPARTVAQP